MRKMKYFPLTFLLLLLVSALLMVWGKTTPATPIYAEPSCVSPPSGIVSWWPGDGNANDIVGSNHGTTQGNATFVTGMVGQAVSLDGDDDFVSVPFNENYNFAPNEQFTLEMWVKPGQAVGTHAVVVRDVFEWDWGIWQYNDSFLTGHNNSNLYGQIDAPFGEWVHVAVIYDSGTHNLYVNGVLDSLSGTQSPITQSDAGLALGRRVGSYYQGVLDEVTMYDRALSSTEIQAIYTAGTAGKCKEFSLFLPIILNPCEDRYLDDFSDTGSGWPTNSSSNTQVEYLGGEYRILLKTADSWAAARPTVKGSDFRVAVDVRNVTGMDGTYGILFGLADDWSQFYTVEIGLDGFYRIWRYSSSGSWTLLEFDSSSHINSGTASNRLQIERNGSQIKAYVNGQLLITITEDSFIGERHVGLIASPNSQSNLDVRFDNFDVCSFSGPLNTTQQLLGQTNLLPDVVWLSDSR